MVSGDNLQESLYFNFGTTIAPATLTDDSPEVTLDRSVYMTTRYFLQSSEDRAVMYVASLLYQYSITALSSDDCQYTGNIYFAELLDVSE